MKLLSSLLLIFLATLIINAQTGIDPDLPTGFGAIESVRSETFELINKQGGIRGERKLWLIEYKYNKQKTKVEEHQYGIDGTVYVVIAYLFDAKLGITNIDYYDRTGLITNNSVFKYRDNGRLLEVAHYYSGSLSFSDVYEFNAQGTRAKIESRFPPDNRVHSKHIHIYDAKSRIVKAVNYSPDERSSNKVFYKYDGRGNLVEWSLYTDGAILYKKLRYKYQFDAQGNWLKQWTFIWSKEKRKYVPELITYRTISYY